MCWKVLPSSSVLFTEKYLLMDFSGGPVAKSLSSQCRGLGFYSMSGN